jgi:stearoyl-CoA desaturase (Delta-9 desaturase)
MDFSPKMFRDIPKVISYHWKEGNLNWPMIIYISLVHVAAAVGMVKAFDSSRETLFWAFLLWPIRYVLHY